LVREPGIPPRTGGHAEAGRQAVRMGWSGKGGEPAGIRTLNLVIKSHLLYR
jgi:hypothetical protein